MRVIPFPDTTPSEVFVPSSETGLRLLVFCQEKQQSIIVIIYFCCWKPILVMLESRSEN